jgi:hypothetical protein
MTLYITDVYEEYTRHRVACGRRSGRRRRRRRRREALSATTSCSGSPVHELLTRI